MTSFEHVKDYNPTDLTPFNTNLSFFKGNLAHDKD